MGVGDSETFAVRLEQSAHHPGKVLLILLRSTRNGTFEQVKCSSKLHKLNHMCDH